MKKMNYCFWNQVITTDNNVELSLRPTVAPENMAVVGWVLSELDCGAWNTINTKKNTKAPNYVFSLEWQWQGFFRWQVRFILIREARFFNVSNKHQPQKWPSILLTRPCAEHAASAS